MNLPHGQKVVILQWTHACSKLMHSFTYSTCCSMLVLYMTMYCAVGDCVIFSKEMWISILHHVVDELEWLLAESGEGKCAHEPLSADDRNKPWLKKNTPAHKTLREVVMDKNILRTLSYYVNFRYFVHI